jgi:uncharacterized protein YqkB
VWFVARNFAGTLTMKLFLAGYATEGCTCWGLGINGKRLGALATDDVIISYDDDLDSDFPQWKVVYHYAFGFCEITEFDYNRFVLLDVLSE